MVWIRVCCVAIAASYFPLCLLNSSFILYFSFAWSVVFPFATASNRSQISYDSSDVRSLARALTAKMFWICSCMTPTSAVLYGVGVFVQSGEKQKRAGTSPIALNSKQLPSDAELRFGFDGFLSIHLSCCLCSSRQSLNLLKQFPLNYFALWLIVFHRNELDDQIHCLQLQNQIEMLKTWRIFFSNWQTECFMISEEKEINLCKKKRSQNLAQFHATIIARSSTSQHQYNHLFTIHTEAIGTVKTTIRECFFLCVWPHWKCVTMSKQEIVAFHETLHSFAILKTYKYKRFRSLSLPLSATHYLYL